MEPQPTGRELIRQMMEHIQHLPEEQQVEALLDGMRTIIDNLSREEVVRLRALLIAKCCESPEMLDLIDGNLALRDIRGVALTQYDLAT